MIYGEEGRNTRVPRVVNEKRRQTSRRMYRVVQRELGKGQERTPTGERRRVASKNIFEDAVHPLSLTIRFRMGCR
ncbi:hypothetical protein PI125_g24442 [Phytophthora idaei]|nr:hypothetical protein PI125_g24442 [Phytophthora idaei]